MLEKIFFKKIESWILYLVIVIGLLFAIFFGVLVRQELIGSIKLGPISKSALFLAEIPTNVKKYFANDFLLGDRFPEIYGFKGKGLDNESYILLPRYSGELQQGIVELVDLKTFKVLHTWNPDFDYLNSLLDLSNEEFKYINRDYNDSRHIPSQPYLTEDGGLITNGIFRKIDSCSNLVWQVDKDIYHHSIEKDADGNFWVPSHIYPSNLPEEKIGRNNRFKDDGITKISPFGEILFEKSITELFIENNMEYLLFSVGDRQFDFDPIHLNDIQPVIKDSEYWKKGDVFLSLRHQSMIILYRPSTNKIIWKVAGYTFHQHDVNILDEYRISIFNNNSKDFSKGDVVDGNNELLIYDFKTNQYKSYLNESFIREDIRTITGGSGLILNGEDLFISESDYGRYIYINSDGTVLWQYSNRRENGEKFASGLPRILVKPNEIQAVKALMETKERCIND